MPKFFIKNKIKIGDIIKLNDNDIHHIIFSLRKISGQYLKICDGYNNDYICLLNDNKTLTVIKHSTCLSEMKTELNIFIAISKSNKLENTIKQCVEIGVYSITIFKSLRCISKINNSKFQRYENIIYSASKQSNRGIIPKLNYIDCFNKAILNAKENNQKLILAHEKSNNKLKNLLTNNYKTIATFTGPEGGFDDIEINLSKKYCDIVSLGNRILRCETAPIYLSSVLSNYYE